MGFKKIIRKTHLLLGLASGIIVFILGITGCIYVFEEEIKPIIYDHYHSNEIKEEKIPISQLLQTVQDTLKNKSATGIHIYNTNENTIRFLAFKNKENASGIWFWDQREYYYTTYINAYTGKIQQLENSTTEFFQIILWLHWSLLLKTKIGQPIVGVACLIFVISLITGLVLWWPKNKKAAKQRFWFRWKPSTKWKRKNYDLHNIFGYYMMLFALIISLTGLVWAFDWFDNSVQWVANGGKKIQNKKEALFSDATQFTNQRPLDKVYAKVKQNYPDAKSYFISLPQDSIAAQRVFVKYKARTRDVSLVFDQYTAQLLNTETFISKNNGEKIRSLNYDIHVGSILGFPGKVLAFFASLVSASLPVTGFMIWMGRRKKESRTNHKTVKKQHGLAPKPRIQTTINEKTYYP
ncbi:PepSY-associated TM helix domain-containing protein [Reichenbachiella sp. MALMAid0571]|uniref:PepSY-associated TM helix domain-containing protein n=1 Tax=Reichenbachiella sp. MALMAid0571 TaxID=3143939 RepID=UPI0032E00430